MSLRDRTAEFRRAKRHSTRVAVLKVLFPLMAAGVLSLYALPYMFRVKIDGGRGVATIKGLELAAGSLKMLNPRMQGVTEQNSVYDVIADSGEQKSKEADVMFLDKIRGKLTSADGKVTTLTAPNGVYNNKLEEMTFNNTVTVIRDDGLRADFKTATAYMKKQMVVSNTPVTVRLHESVIIADRMTLYSGDKRAIFEGNVKTHVQRETPGAETGVVPGAGQR